MKWTSAEEEKAWIATVARTQVVAKEKNRRKEAVRLGLGQCQAGVLKA